MSGAGVYESAFHIRGKLVYPGSNGAGTMEEGKKDACVTSVHEKGWVGSGGVNS